MSFKPYDEYRSVDEDRIPTHWIDVKLGRLVRCGMGQTILRDMLVPASTVGAVPVYSASENVVEFGYFPNPQVRLKKNDLVIGARGSIGLARKIDRDATCTQTTIWLSIEDNHTDADFLYWVLIGQRERLFPFDKTAIPMLTVEQVRKGRIYLPPLTEQTAIARFLDRETVKIDALVEEQKRLIKLLKEKRQAVISHAVTKGLNPGVAMKPSGVEWLGDVPEHWDVTQLRHLTVAIFSGIAVPQIEPSEATVPVTRIETISQNIVNFDKVGFIPRSEAREDRRIQRGDVIFSNINSLPMVGNTAQFDGDQELYAGINLLNFRPAGELSQEWFGWLFKVPTFRQMVEALAKPAINQASVSQTSLRSIFVPKPPREEQVAIAHHIESQLKQMAMLDEQVMASVSLLQERRAALISAAVTGMINVCDAVGAKAEAA